MPAALPQIHAPVASPPAAHAPAPHFIGGGAPDTQQLHTKNGVYHPERAALHDKIVEHFLGKADDAKRSQLYRDFGEPGHKPRAIFTMGGSGSGKSWYLEKRHLQHSRFALVDPDAVKAHLPEFDPKRPETAMHTHEESSDIAKRIQSEAHKRGLDYVYDGTGANAPSFAKKLQAAKDAGYHVELHRVHVPTEIALQRNAQRERALPEHLVRQIHATVADSFHKVKHLADRVKVFDSSNEFKSPFAVRREEILANRAAGMGGANEVQKGMSQHTKHHDHAAHYAPKLAKGCGMKKIEIDVPGQSPHYMIGKIEKGAIKVLDVVHDGLSEHAMTDQHPKLRPIPLDELEKRFPGQVKVSDW